MALALVLASAAALDLVLALVAEIYNSPACDQKLLDSNLRASLRKLDVLNNCALVDLVLELALVGLVLVSAEQGK